MLIYVILRTITIYVILPTLPPLFSYGGMKILNNWVRGGGDCFFKKSVGENKNEGARERKTKLLGVRDEMF